MTLVGLDLNTSRLRAVKGDLGDYPASLPLQLNDSDLPLALGLEQSRIEVGSVAEKLRRRLPHLCCHSFLPTLGESRRWRHGRKDLDSVQALHACWLKVKDTIGTVSAVVSVPTYLSRWQADQVRFLACKAGLKVQVSVPSVLAAAIAGHAEGYWNESVLVVAIDEHCLELAWIQAAGGNARLCEYRSLPHLGWNAWRERLINAVADCCVMQSRRDPRDCGEAEQHIYDQIDLLLDASAQGRMAQPSITAKSWFQNLVLSPDEIAAFCRPYVQHCLREIQRGISVPQGQTPQAVLLTHEAARLPGLVAAASRLLMSAPVEVSGTPRPPSDEDFGINLLRDSGEDRSALITLSRDALAQASFLLAGTFQHRGMDQGHLEASAPLSLPWPAEAGPARLSCQGETYILDGSTFLVGSQTGCHFHVNAERFPGVAPRHCEIFFDHRTFVLFNRSRDGTFVNSQLVMGTVVLQAGDSIRLGPLGPSFRFLGQAGPARRDTTLSPNAR